MGSGPAGLCAAHFLNQQGFGVTVFEAAAQAGGMLRRGINAFRLPRPVLDAEIAGPGAASGVDIITSAAGWNRPRDLLEQGFDAVLLATGHPAGPAPQPARRGAGRGGATVWTSCPQVNLGLGGSVGQRTVVIGGGNSAMDAARTALRLGATLRSPWWPSRPSTSCPPRPEQDEGRGRRGGRGASAWATPRWSSSGEGLHRRGGPRRAHWELARGQTAAHCV